MARPRKFPIDVVKYTCLYHVLLYAFYYICIRVLNVYSYATL